jgi:hypothetical protein
MDFVSVWKASSIVLTGAFGVLGLLTEFKDKESRKITHWGYVSLAGILVSTILGAAAQIKESADDAEKSLAIVTGIQRELSPSVGELNFTMYFTVDCKNPDNKKICDNFTTGFDEIRYGDIRWSRTFGKDYRGHDSRFEYVAYINSKDKNGYDVLILSLECNDNQESLDSLKAYHDPIDNTIRVEDPYSRVLITRSDGTIHSMMDLVGKTMSIHGNLGKVSLSLGRLFAQGKTGEQVTCRDIRSDVVTGSEVCTFRNLGL